MPIFNLNLLSCCRKVLKSNKCIFLFIEGFENSFSSVIHLLSSLLIQIYNAKLLLPLTVLVVLPTLENTCEWRRTKNKKKRNENTKLKIWKLRFSSTFGKCLQPFQINLPRQWDTMNKAPLQEDHESSPHLHGWLLREKCVASYWLKEFLPHIFVVSNDFHGEHSWNLFHWLFWASYKFRPLFLLFASYLSILVGVKPVWKIRISISPDIANSLSHCWITIASFRFNFNYYLIQFLFNLFIYLFILLIVNIIHWGILFQQNVFLNVNNSFSVAFVKSHS